MKCLLVSLTALMTSLSLLVSSSARASSIASCQGKQVAAIVSAIEGNPDYLRVYERGFLSMNFGFDDTWQSPTISVLADVSENSPACEIGFRLEPQATEVLGCADYIAREYRVECPDLCKSCGMVIER